MVARFGSENNLEVDSICAQGTAAAGAAATEREEEQQQQKSEVDFVSGNLQLESSFNHALRCCCCC